ncbi:hypothetical protein BJV77DRAFT_603284 [Russula vinacea]|nr:hypothetical protein BJV77DRAFT_603284 [Russula vinacea]
MLPSGMDIRDHTVSAQTYLSVVKYTHVMCGLFLWEFFTTLDYEWKVIRGHLPYRWTIWIYSFARVTALVGVVLCLVIMNTTTAINCQLWVSLSATFFNLSEMAASLLIVLRIIAIWNKHRVAVMLAITVWGIDVVFHIQSVALVNGQFQWFLTHCH